MYSLVQLINDITYLLSSSYGQGKVTPLSEQVLVVKYLPGLPEHFTVSFEVRHFIYATHTCVCLYT